MLEFVALGLTAYMLKDEMKFDASTLSISSRCEAVVKLGEGFKPTAYVVPNENQYTIGWGSTSSNHSNIKAGVTLPQSVLQKMLEQDLAIRETFIKSKLKGVKLTQGQFDALVSTKYNANSLFTSTSNLEKHLRAGNDEAARLELDFWKSDMSNGAVAPGLVKRRMLEHILWLNLPIPDKKTYDSFINRVDEFAKTKDSALLRF